MMIKENTFSKFSVRAVILTVCLVFLANVSCTPEYSTKDPVLSKEIKELTNEDISRMVAVVKTNMGTFKIALHPEWAPESARNFIKLVRSGFYNSLTFHIVRDDLWIVGGSPNGESQGGPGYYVKLEKVLAEYAPLHLKGRVGLYHPEMKMDEGGSQFYIMLTTYTKFDGGYNVFGEVIEGMAVVERMSKVKVSPVDSKIPYRPLEPIIMENIFLVAKKAES